MSDHHRNCGQSTNWTCPCTCDEEYWADTDIVVTPPAPIGPTMAQMQEKLEALTRYVQHDTGCSANDLDYLDRTPCTCGLRALYSPKGIQP